MTEIVRVIVLNSRYSQYSVKSTNAYKLYVLSINPSSSAEILNALKVSEISSNTLWFSCLRVAIAASLNNLAESYRVMGRYSEAEPFFVRSLAIRKQQLGADYPADVKMALRAIAQRQSE